MTRYKNTFDYKGFTIEIDQSEDIGDKYNYAIFDNKTLELKQADNDFLSWHIALTQAKKWIDREEHLRSLSVMLS